MQIIIGLGNPGKKYENTRHNAGFIALDALAKKNNLSWQSNKKLKSLICKSGNTLYAKPQTFMNNSGQAVQAILSYYKLLPLKLKFIKQKNADLSNILTVIHDDLDIDLGKYKNSINSRSAGHKGVESIINYLKTKNFKRIRLGIRSDLSKQIPAKNFVLSKFNKKEIDAIKNSILLLA